jgi:hypothetical protein
MRTEKHTACCWPPISPRPHTAGALGAGDTPPSTSPLVPATLVSPAWPAGTPHFQRKGGPTGKRFNSHTCDFDCFLGMAWSFLGRKP